MDKNLELRIIQHYDNLAAIFNLPVKTDAEKVKFCKQLRRIETQANYSAVKYCNGELETEEFEKLDNLFIWKLAKLGIKGDGVFINGDPRGYALKIKDDVVKDLTIYKDWGGYGIIAPDLR